MRLASRSERSRRPRSTPAYPLALCALRARHEDLTGTVSRKMWAGGRAPRRGGTRGDVPADLPAVHNTRKCLAFTHLRCCELLPSGGPVRPPFVAESPRLGAPMAEWGTLPDPCGSAMGLEATTAGV